MTHQQGRQRGASASGGIAALGVIVVLGVIVGLLAPAWASPTRYRPRRPPGPPPTAITRADIVAALRPLDEPVRACARHAPAATGLLKLRITVRPDGRVGVVEVVATPVPGIAVCAAALVERVTFKATDLGGRFTFPWRLVPR